MIRHDWLLSYRQEAGIHRALQGIEGRLSRPSGLSRAMVDLRQDYRGFEADFRAFFPELVAFATVHKAGTGLSADQGGHGGG